MSNKFGIAHCHASISKHGTVAHQVLCYRGLAKPDSHMKSNNLASRGIVFVAKNVMTGINLVLDPQSLLGLTTLISSSLP